MEYKSIGDFLSHAPLYKKSLISDITIISPISLNDTTFDYYCFQEEAVKTHMLTIWPTLSSLDYSGPTWRNDIDMILDSDHRFHFTHQYRGICQSCKTRYIDFLLEIQGEDLYDDSIDPSEPPLINAYFTKVGSNPPYEIAPHKESHKFFTKEDRLLYRKALVCLSQSYGIGAYAYFRRILENEIIRILDAIASLPMESSIKVKELLNKYKVDHQMGYLVEGVYPYLPDSIKSLGDNPLKLLYGLLSGGLHGQSDDQCMTKAETINELLIFLIVKISEERTSNSRLRNLISKLRE